MKLPVTLALAGALCAASPAASLEVTCDFVRAYRADIEAATRAERTYWVKKLKITRKQRRQAMACLKGRD